MTGRVWLPCIIGAALVAAAPAASAQAPAPPTKAQAFTVAGDVAAGWGGALDAAGVDIEPCERTGAVRRCEVHVFDFEADASFDCHWWVRVRVASGDTLAWRTIRRPATTPTARTRCPPGRPRRARRPSRATGASGPRERHSDPLASGRRVGGVRSA